MLLQLWIILHENIPNDNTLLVHYVSIGLSFVVLRQAEYFVAKTTEAKENLILHSFIQTQTSSSKIEESHKLSED